jgi:hypothetical protein
VILLLLLSTLRSASGDAADDDAYITFGALRLANHSYVDVSGVTAADPDKVVCHTHLHTCCSAAQGPDRGDWYDPGGAQIRFPDSDWGVHQSRLPQRVELRCGERCESVSGLYRCDVAVKDHTRLSQRKRLCTYHTRRNVIFSYQWSKSSIHPLLYLHRWTWYHRLLDTRLRPSHPWPHPDYDITSH